MFSNKKNGNEKIGKIETLVGSEAKFQGTIFTKGTLRVDGIVDGGIAQAEGVIIGEHGSVKGNINAQSVIVGGQITGNVTTSHSIELLAHGKISGDIKTAQLSIAEGAIFEGSCTMQKEKANIIEPEFKKKEKIQ